VNSEDLADRVVFRVFMIQMDGRLIMHILAVPISKNGEIIGACGVGGSSGEDDEQCAYVGVAPL